MASVVDRPDFVVGDGFFDIQAFLDQEHSKDLLRLTTAGSVDDGKSTLIGRMLQTDPRGTIAPLALRTQSFRTSSNWSR